MLKNHINILLRIFQKVKILYIHQYFNTPEMPGSTRSYEFAKRLVLSGDDVHIATSNWQNKSKDKFSKVDGN